MGPQLPSFQERQGKGYKEGPEAPTFKEPLQESEAIMDLWVEKSLKINPGLSFPVPCVTPGLSSLQVLPNIQSPETLKLGLSLLHPHVSGLGMQ